MTTSRCLLVGLLIAMSVTVFAQIPAGQRVGLARYLQVGYTGLKRDLTEAAEKMPEADYGFKPGSTPEVRTYGQVIAHVADGQFSTCAAVKGVANPNEGKDVERQFKTKADVTRALADSFAFCDDLLSSLTDATVTQFVKQGQGELERGAALVGLIAHNAEMYGIATVYLRSKNIVPPSTERRGRGRGGD
ncbi:MAG TPA: DinB family protein [Vicinamibacterales bacterium]|nr:DinB family protein [Vicinamibacterales bacterium]